MGFPRLHKKKTQIRRILRVFSRFNTSTVETSINQVHPRRLGSKRRLLKDTVLRSPSFSSRCAWLHTRRGDFASMAMSQMALEQDVKLQSRRLVDQSPGFVRNSAQKKKSLDVSHTESIWKTLVTIEGNPHALHLGDPCALYICKKWFHSTVATTTISKFEDRFSAVPAYHNEGVCSLRQAWLPPLPHHGRIDEPLNALNRPNPISVSCWAINLQPLYPKTQPMPGHMAAS